MRGSVKGRTRYGNRSRIVSCMSFGVYFGNSLEDLQQPIMTLDPFWTSVLSILILHRRRVGTLKAGHHVDEDSQAEEVRNSRKCRNESQARGSW
jgi:hypothetical protein